MIKYSWRNKTTDFSSRIFKGKKRKGGKEAGGKKRGREIGRRMRKKETKRKRGKERKKISQKAVSGFINNSQVTGTHQFKNTLGLLRLEKVLQS